MGAVHEAIDDRLAAWIVEQPMFFVATGRPLTTTSTGTSRVFPIRDRSRCQYGF